jgi:hypothetical protein
MNVGGDLVPLRVRHRLGWFDVKDTASGRCLDPVEVASPSPWASIHEIGFLCACHVNWGRQLEGWITTLIPVRSIL